MLGRRSVFVITGAVSLTLAAFACSQEDNTPITVDNSSGTPGSGGMGGTSTAMGGTSSQGGMPGTGGAGNTPTGMEAWHEETSTQSAMKNAIEYLEGYGLYAMVGDHISRWSGVAWQTMTDDQAGIRAAFQILPNELLGEGGAGGIGGAGGGEPLPDPDFAAVVVNMIYRYDGLNWTAITNAAPGMDPAFHHITDDDIYAMVDDHIEWWDGTTWTLHTTDMLGMKAAMHYVAPEEIYAVVDSYVAMWNGTDWVAHTTEIAGLRPAIHVMSPTEIYAVVNNQVCVWGGTSWAPLTDEITGLDAAFHPLALDNVYAKRNDQKIWRWFADTE